MERIRANLERREASDRSARILGMEKYYPDLYFYTKKNKMSVEPLGRRNKGC